ncbi:MAG TPA: ABC transporter permease [Candidatus Polarisedimenticolia bacterium]
MLIRLLGRSIAREPRRKLLSAASLALGITVTTATLSIVLDIEDRLAREFRSLGANLLVTPRSDTLPLDVGGVDLRPVGEGATLSETDLGRLRTIFWRLNIIGFTPLLELPVEVRAEGRRAVAPRTTLVGTWYEHAVAVPDGSRFTTGLKLTHPWWTVEGRWFEDDAEECLAGAALARRAGLRPGDRLTVRAGDATRRLTISGLVTTGGPEEESLVAPLRIAQDLSGLPGRFRRLMVSALTTPENDFARRDPARMTPADYDRWYCTPYIGSIARQIEEVLPGTEARAIRRVAESEGNILSRVHRLMGVITAAALFAAALAIGVTSATTVLERRSEIGLMKALGARSALVASFFLAEQLLMALGGGAAGYGLGIVLGRWLGRSIFGVAPAWRLLLLPVILGVATLVALAGNLLPLRRVARLQPAPILRGD